MGKRIFDMILLVLLILPALAIIVLVLPVLALQTGFRPLFTQVRVGKNGRPFRIVKLRTMSLATPDVASHEVSTAAITRFGGILRKTKIDELPQLWNVLAGHMSFVGPRPCLPSQHAVIDERAKRGVDNIRPGITGPSQLAGIDMSSPVELAEMDSSYLGPWSPLRDLSLLAATGMGRGTRDAARLR